MFISSANEMSLSEVMSALGRLLKKSSLEQILLNRKDMLEGIYFLPWDGQQDDLKRYWCFYRCFKYLWA